MHYTIEQLKEVPTGTIVYSYGTGGVSKAIFIAVYDRPSQEGYWISNARSGYFQKATDILRVTDSLEDAVAGHKALVQNRLEDRVSELESELEDAIINASLEIRDPECSDFTTLSHPLEYYVAIEESREARIDLFN